MKPWIAAALLGLASCAHHDAISCAAECQLEKATCECSSEDNTGGEAAPPTGAVIGAVKPSKETP